jgi:predicted anti-sigma-YlaC factor YlaD
MNCDEARLVLSAVLDDEAAPGEGSAAEEHVATCARCTEWAVAMHGVNRSMRLEEAAVTDMTAPIMAAWDRSQAETAQRAPVFARVGLLAMGLVELFLSIPLLLETRPQFLGGMQHAGRELGAFGVMLAAAFILAAWDGRARGRFEVVATAIGLLVLTGLSDILHAETVPHYEVAHLPSVVGLGLLWLLYRREPPLQRPRTGFRRPDPAGIGRTA